MTTPRSALLLLCAALPALAADTRFQAARMSRDDVPPGKGQCDIRLQVDNQVQVSVRGDQVSVHTVAGKGARDDGSECNVPMPREVQAFHFEVKDSRGEIRLVAEPSKRNDWSAIVAIRDTAGGEGRYHFRLNWLAALPGAGGDHPRRDEDFERPRPGGTFSWNNTISFKGKGSGAAALTGLGDLRLTEVSIDVDRGDKLVANFRADRGRPVIFSGQIMVQENGRWKADVMSEDHRLRGSMYFTVDDRRQVNNVTLDASDGRDHMRLNWDRR